MRLRVEELIERFPEFVDEFEMSGLFSGPSVYFHQRTLELLAQHNSPAAAVQDRGFVEILYAMLTSWGLHRMGPTGAKLSEFEVLRKNLSDHVEEIEELHNLTIWDMGSKTTQEVQIKLWALMDGLKVGANQTRIVSGSKAVHHILPDLVPPIDREYTLRFFYSQANLKSNGEEEFMEMYPYFVRIARECRDEIEMRMQTSGAMNTSITKVIDNAIVGWGLREKAKKNASR